MAVLAVESDSTQHVASWRSGLPSASRSLDGGGAADQARTAGDGSTATADRVRWLAWSASWVESISACGSTGSARAGVAGETCEGDDGGGWVGHSILGIALVLSNLDSCSLCRECSSEWGQVASQVQGCGACWGLLSARPVFALCCPRKTCALDRKYAKLLHSDNRGACNYPCPGRVATRSRPASECLGHSTK